MLIAEEAPTTDRPLRESVRDAIRSRIFEGHYAPGTRLVERDLAAEFNVSRLPIREALRMLRQEGLIQDRASRGSEVAGLSPKDVEDLFDVRQSLEVLACRLAAARATDKDLKHLAGLLDEADRFLAKGSILEAHRANLARPQQRIDNLELSAHSGCATTARFRHQTQPRGCFGRNDSHVRAGIQNKTE